MMNFRIAVILVLFAFAKKGAGQSYYFRHYKVENGLSYNSVLCGLQDSKGFLWFGTKAGLNRFDGYTFKVFHKDFNDSAGLHSNFIKTIYEDFNKILWIGTLKGLYQYDAETENFTLLKATLNQQIGDIQMDKKGNLWYVSNSTLHKYNPKTKTAQTYNNKDYFPVTSICLTPEGILWVSTPFGTLERYNPGHDTFIKYDVFANSKPVNSKWIETLHAVDNHSILIGTSKQGAKLFDIVSETYKDLPLHNSDSTEIYVRDFMCYSDEEYWIGTESGLFIYNIKKNKAVHLQKNHYNPYSISDNAIYTLFKDIEGGVWIGTYFGGINYSPNSHLTFDKYFPANDPSSISGNIVREICRDKNGNLWIGTEDAGLNKFNPDAETFKHFKPTGKAGSVTYSNIHALLAVDNELWIGTYDHGLDVMDLKTEKIIRHYNAGKGDKAFKNNFIVTAYQTRSSDILIGTWSGLYRYNKDKDGFTLVKHVPPSASIYAILEDSKGTIWIGTKGNGVYFFNNITKKKGHFNYEAGNKNSLSSSLVNDIFEDSDKNLWFATEDGGLCKFDSERNTFIRYTVKEGFPSNFIFKILEDGKKNLWISTSKGLVCFNPSKKNLKIYSKANGLLSEQFNYNSAYKDVNGQMYFGSINGLISFNPAEYKNNNHKPPVYITGFQINNRELIINGGRAPLKRSISYTRNLVLKHNQSSFSIDFAALNYTAPEMTEYAYKMEGLDKDWTYLKRNRKAYFTQLLPGTYTFLVKASAGGGVWDTPPAMLEIRIQPPFYASIWAYILYIIIIGFISYIIIRSYHRKTEKKNNQKIERLENEKEKEIYQAKIDFFTNITHEIRTPLTLIQAPLEKVKASHNINEIKDYTCIIEKNTAQLSKLINQLLDFRKTETNLYSLSFVRTNISELLKDIYLQFKGAAEQKDLSFNSRFPQNTIYAYVDQAAFNKIVGNLLNNAVKYAESYVEVELNLLNEGNTAFFIEVKNDGYLIPSTLRETVFHPFFRIKDTNKELGAGIGLPLARSMAELHHGTLELKKQSSDLNIFRLTLPVHQDKEFELYSDIPEKSETATKKYEQSSIDPLKQRILIVEDNTDILQFITKELNKTYTVLQASNGAEALAILDHQAVQLIISDVIMPVMDGFELCNHIKTNLNFSHIPVILLTAKNTIQAKIEGLGLGADAYIEKPFSPEHLQVQITNLLHNRQKIKEHFAKSPLVHIKSIAYSKEDENFLEKLMSIIYENISNSQLDIEQLAGHMCMSRTTLFRKIKAISDLTPNELINLARLKRAAELLAGGDYKIYEVSNMIGFSSQSNFARIFQKQFGMAPSEYAQNKSNTNQV